MQQFATQNGPETLVAQRPALTTTQGFCAMAERYISDLSSKEEAAFWAKVDKRGANECWPWLGAKRKRGHGTAYANKKVVCATHIALILVGKPRPAAPANHALHSCDNPPCVNPAHLRWGTNKENTEDRKERFGPIITGVRGERVGTSKITETIVRRILESPLRSERLAEYFDLSPTTVCEIRRGRRWRHVAGPRQTEELRFGENHHSAKLAEDDVRCIRLRSPTETTAAIAREYGVSESTIGNIRKGRTWKQLPC